MYSLPDKHSIDDSFETFVNSSFTLLKKYIYIYTGLRLLFFKSAGSVFQFFSLPKKQLIIK